MKKLSTSERILLEEISEAARTLQRINRGLAVGDSIKLIRMQLDMSQAVLAKRAGIPQSAISRIELNQKIPTIPTLSKIYEALSCTLVIGFSFKEPIDAIKLKQAKHVAERQIRYLKGTMNLEKQEPDKRLADELLKNEINDLLRNPGRKLWGE